MELTTSANALLPLNLNANLLQLPCIEPCIDKYSVNPPKLARKRLQPTDKQTAKKVISKPMQGTCNYISHLVVYFILFTKLCFESLLCFYNYEHSDAPHSGCKIKDVICFII